MVAGPNRTRAPPAPLAAGRIISSAIGLAFFLIVLLEMQRAPDAEPAQAAEPAG